MKIIVTKDGKVFKDNTLLKPRLFKGYLRVKINGSTHLVHRLVALTYIPNPENKPCVCHKDNNPLNNNVDNLYWGSVEDNIRDREGRYEIGDITRYKLRTGLHKSMVKICVKYLRDLGYSWKDIRIALHLSRVAIEKYKKP